MLWLQSLCFFLLDFNFVLSFFEYDECIVIYFRADIVSMKVYALSNFLFGWLDCLLEFRIFKNIPVFRFKALKNLWFYAFRVKIQSLFYSIVSLCKLLLVLISSFLHFARIICISEELNDLVILFIHTKQIIRLNQCTLSLIGKAQRCLGFPNWNGLCHVVFGMCIWESSLLV